MLRRSIQRGVWVAKNRYGHMLGVKKQKPPDCSGGFACSLTKT